MSYRPEKGMDKGLTDKVRPFAVPAGDDPCTALFSDYNFYHRRVAPAFNMSYNNGVYSLKCIKL